MVKVNIVNHTHWDREWYFSTMDSLVLSDQVFTEVLDELNRDKEASFCLDGQISILEDYLSIRPEKLKEIQKLVKEERLFIGPWYTQTDTQLVSVESILRNLTIGINEAEKIGEYMKIGYLPDTFGFNSQMPTILQSCGIDNIIFWRGIDYDKIKSPYFIWKGLGDEKVIAVNFINGYGSIPKLYDDKNFRDNKLFPLVNKIKELTNLEEIIIPIGNDQAGITLNIQEKINNINKYSEDSYFASNYEKFIGFLRNNKSKLKVYEGEFRTPKTGRVHKTIGSVRYDLKKNNFDAEQMLLNRVEPLYAIAKNLGLDISKELIIKAWKKLMEGQAHDGICGCITDDVASDILYRIKQVKEICEGLENLIKYKLSERIGLKQDQVIIFNTLPYEYKGYKKVEFVSMDKEVILKDVENFAILNIEEFEKRKNILVESPEGNYYIDEALYYKITALVKVKLPSMGYKVFQIEKSKANMLVNDNRLEIKNEFYNITIKNNKLYLKLSNDEVIEDFIIFEDCGNDGDTYDFSPLRNDKPIYFRVTEGKRHISNGIEKLTLKGKKSLPENLEDRISMENLNKLNITLEIVLLEGSPIINCRITVDNNINSHRLRVGIRSEINSHESIASVPFGYIKRPTLDIKDWQSNYLEKPIDIEVFEETVSVTDNKNTLSIYSKGIKEYQVVDDIMYLTLLSTTSQLGKPDLLYRPGRASGDTTKQGHIMMPTPLAEQKGIKKFSFGISIKEENFNERVVAKRYETFTTQNISYQMQTLNKFINRLDNKIQPLEKIKNDLEREYSLLSIDNNVVFSSISPSLKDIDAVLLRVKNPSCESIFIDKKDFSKFKKWKVVNNIEEEKENKLIVKPYNMLTIKLWY
jgi:alpha-mannosidase